MPVDDSKGHTFCTTCACSPDVMFENGWIIVVHDAFDGRDVSDKSKGWAVVTDEDQYNALLTGGEVAEE